MSELPTPVSESTAIEVVRKEGSTRSQKAVDTITAGEILTINNSGAVRAIGLSGIAPLLMGVALYTATSGNRVVTIRGKLRSFWDGAGTVVNGTPIAVSTTRSGWFEPYAGTSGINVIGYFFGDAPGASLAASNSGTLQVVDIL